MQTFAVLKALAQHSECAIHAHPVPASIEIIAVQRTVNERQRVLDRAGDGIFEGETTYDGVADLGDRVGRDDRQTRGAPTEVAAVEDKRALSRVFIEDNGIT